MMEADDEPTTTHAPLPIRFRLLYNWTQGLDQDPLLQHKVSMYPSFQVELHDTPIYRLIDHTLITMNLQQRRQHWISAGQLWKACGLTLTEGLFLFQLAPSHYQLDFLIPSFPYQDVWVPLTLARSMATTLGVLDDLAWFLDDSVLSKVESADHADRLEMVHNWRILGIPNTSYSTRALLDYSLVAGEPLDIITDTDLLQHHQQKTTTLMTRHEYQPGIVMKDRAETGLARWQSWAYEQFLATHNMDTSLLSKSDDGGGARRRRKSKIHWENDNTDGRFLDDFGHEPIILDNGPDDSVPATALWDVIQGLLCDLQSLERRQQQVDVISDLDDEQQLLKASRVFSDSMVIGNMPLKSAFLRQSPALQHIYLSVMMEKLYHAMAQLCATTIKQKQQYDMDILLTSTAQPPPVQQQQDRFYHSHKGLATTPTTTSASSTTQSEKKSLSRVNSTRQQGQRPRSLHLGQNNISASTTAPAQMDPNMMLHDRMDLLEQEMYRIKKKAKRKMDESELKSMELQHHLMTLDTWKRNLETRRKNERAWMLLIILLLSFVLWISL
ncbi:hypothetical protein [Absidia glauca]|uniref:Uncharacterized protein n=1 Tax=Absidia glauca TaxID=4829 RepID=A0A168LTF0_ABSGL|nr:hypothetical protein [Absidia glauca]